MPFIFTKQLIFHSSQKGVYSVNIGKYKYVELFLHEFIVIPLLFTMKSNFGYVINT